MAVIVTKTVVLCRRGYVRYLDWIFESRKRMADCGRFPPHALHHNGELPQARSERQKPTRSDRSPQIISMAAFGNLPD